MRKTMTASIALTCALAAGQVFAHHAPAALGTMHITQPVRAGDTVLQPGTYEVRDTGDHAKPLPGQSEDAQAVVEFLRDGMVVAREVAEVMPSAAVAVGTSGAASGGSATRARVERLKADPFLRVSMHRNGERYLIHLPFAR